MSIRSSFGAPQSNVHDPFSLHDWDPFKDFHLESVLPKETVTFVNVRTEWKDTPEAHILKADLPGLRKDEVRVQVEGNVLKISGERNVEREEKKDKWHCIQRSSGKFLRVYRLPENVKVDEVKGSMKDGMLTVTVPKEVKNPFVKIIEITGLE